MWPLLSGLITGGASLLGNMFSSRTASDNTQMNINAQQAAQKESEQFNAQQAEINRQFQTQMSNTAYQRSSEDMKAAGLNPMMMFGSGGAASTPGGATASTSTPNMAFANRKSALGDLGGDVSKVVSTAIATKTYEKMVDEIAQLRTQTAKTAAETETEKERPQQVREQTVSTSADIAKKLNEMPGSRLAGITAQGIIDMSPELRRKLVQAGFIAEKADKVTDAVSGVVSSALGVKNLFRPKTVRTTKEDQYGNRSSSFEERFGY